MNIMARPKEFERDEALKKAITVFSRHGYEGTPTDALLSGMGIRRQSMYDTFGDKWRLYLEALRTYNDESITDQLRVLTSASGGLRGIEALFEHMVGVATRDPSIGCLGVNAVCEFGRDNPEIALLGDVSHKRLMAGIERNVSMARDAGEIGADLDVAETADFLAATLTSLRVAARGGASADRLRGIARMALRGLT